MKPLSPLTAAVVVLTAPLAASLIGTPSVAAQEVLDEREIQSALSRAERRVDSAAGALEDYQSASDFAKERQAERFMRAMERALEALEALAGAGRDAELRARLDSLQAAFDTASQATAAAVGNEDAARARLEDWRESGELARDIEALEDMQTLLADARRFDVGSGLFGRFGDPAALDAFVERVASWDETLAAFESLATKYESLGDRVYFRSAGAYAAIRDIQNRLPGTEAAMARFKSEAPAAVDAALDEAEALARNAVAEERFGVFTGLNAPMRMALIAPDAMVRVYEALPITSPAEAQTLRASYQSRLDEIEQLKAQAAESIIASNSLPLTGYSGSDIDAVTTIARAGFEQIHGRQTILDIRIPAGNWTRHQGWRWDRVARAYQRYDYSTIDAYVVERTNGRVATFWRITVHRKHLEGDALIADPASRTRHAPGPDQQILLSNL